MRCGRPQHIPAVSAHHRLHRGRVGELRRVQGRIRVVRRLLVLDEAVEAGRPGHPHGATASAGTLCSAAAKDEGSYAGTAHGGWCKVSMRTDMQEPWQVLQGAHGPW